MFKEEIKMVRTVAYGNGDFKVEHDKEKLEKHLNSKTPMWVDFINPSEDEIKLLGEVFNFHNLAVEDCIHRLQRPKVDNYKSYYFVVLNAFKGRDARKEFQYSEIYIFISENYLVTIHWQELEVIKKAHERIVNGINSFEKGMDFVFYTLLDEIVDDYFPITDKIGYKIEDLEEVILQNPNKQIQNDILNLKRNILRLRRVLAPQREVVNILLRHDFGIIKEENKLYYMDVYDHLLRIFDLIDTYQDLLAGTLDLYMSQISNRMNEIMKVLTIITTLMMPMTVISGIYGMNFQFMPGLQSKAGFSVAIILMLVIMSIEVIYFKIKKWL